MIAASEDVFARDIEQPRQFDQSCAFVIIGVTKTKVNGVALIVEFWLFCPRLINKLSHAIHLLLTGRDQSSRPVDFINDAGLRFLVYEVDHFSEDGLRR